MKIRMRIKTRTKMKTKKPITLSMFVFALILALALSITLTACGSSNNSYGSNGADANANSSANNDANSTSAASANNANDAKSSSNFNTSRDITVIAREDGSGTKSAFMELIGLKDKEDPATVIIQGSTAAVNAEVRSNPGALAYESLGFVDVDVKIVAINGVEATVVNILNGTYLLTRPLQVVYQESSLDDDVNSAFFTFLQSSDAQKIIADGGFVSVVDDAAAYTINGSLSGSIDVSGSTSLQPLMIDLVEAFKVLQPNITVNVSGGGSGTGYNNAENGVSAFGMISEEFDPVKRNTPSLTAHEVAKDGIAVIVHKDNPLDNITTEQLKNIYDSEAGDSAITVWNQLITE